MRAVYGRSPWVDLFPKSRVPSYPRLRGELDVEVAIIGGGLTGCATAYAFAASGIRVALFEAEKIGRGGSGASAGWITDEPSARFSDIEKTLGRRTARHVWQAWRRSALDLEATIRRLNIRCAPAARNSLVIAQRTDQVMQIAREQKIRRDAGIDAVAVPQRAIAAVAGFPAAAAMRTRESAAVDPYRLTLGFASAAAARGAAIFEQSAVTRTAFTRHDATVSVGLSRVRARRIVVATGGLTPLFRPLARHVSARVSYLALTEPVPARIRRSLGARDYLVRDLADPPHRISWVDDDRLLVSGADAAPAPARSRDSVLVQRTGQLMYELSTMYPDISGLQAAYGWDASYSSTPDGLPFIGPHRNYPHHLFAVADASHSHTGAFLASRILLRQHLDDTQQADAAFGFGR